MTCGRDERQPVACRQKSCCLLYVCTTHQASMPYSIHEYFCAFVYGHLFRLGNKLQLRLPSNRFRQLVLGERLFVWIGSQRR